MAKKFRGQGKGKKQVACTLPIPLYTRLQQLADASGVTVSDYARKAIIKTVQEWIRFEEIEHSGAVGTIVVGHPIAELPPPIDATTALRAAEMPELPYGSKKASAGRKTS